MTNRLPASAYGLAPLLGLALFTSLAGCNDEGPLMRPGENCLSCHSAGGMQRAPHYTVAGTVFALPGADVNSGSDGITVTITDAANKTITLVTNSAGNFYTAQAVTYPISARLTKGSTTVAMSQTVSDGGCASCHTVPPQMLAPGRVYIP